MEPSQETQREMLPPWDRVHPTPENLNSYQYQPLHHEREIRLLQLLPGDEESPICCEIVHRDLDPDCLCPYDALSYAWKEDPALERQRETIGKKIMQEQERVAAQEAFRQGEYFQWKILRIQREIEERREAERSAPKYILCNTQNTRLEVTRNCFIALYLLRNKEEQKTIWVDAVCVNQSDNAEKSHQVVMMRDIFQYANQVLVFPGPLLQDQPTSLEPLYRAFEQLGDHIRLLGPRRDPHPLSYQAWFTRVWVLQEVILARKLAFILGKRTISADTPMAKHVFSLDRRRPALGRTVLHIHAEIWSERPTLFELLLLSEKLRSTDDRDKIFGLLGIASDGRDELYRVDYGETVEQVYTRFARAFISRSRALEILSLAGIGRSGQLPSWVPDWRNLPEEDHVFGPPKQRNHPFQAYAGLTAYDGGERVTQMPKALVVKGIRFATVTAIFNPSKGLVRIPGLCRDVLRVARPLDPYPTGESIEDVVFKIIKASGSSFNGTVNGVPWSEFCNTVKAEDNNKTVEVPEGIGPPELWEHRWFTTSNGYLGICGVDVRPKDEICCLAGGQVPFILRDLEDDDTGQNVRLVGDAHVQGIMKWEAMACRTMEELSTFIIH